MDHGLGAPLWLSGKESNCQCRRCGFSSWAGKIPWRREWQPTPVFLPRKFHGQRSLTGYSSWGHKRVRCDLVTKTTLIVVLKASNLQPLSEFGTVGKESACQRRRHKKHGFDSWVRKIFWSRKWQPTPAFLPRKFHAQRSVAGYSPWGHKECLQPYRTE